MLHKLFSKYSGTKIYVLLPTENIIASAINWFMAEWSKVL